MVGIFQKINLLLDIYKNMYGNVQIVNLRASEKQHCCNYQAVRVDGTCMYSCGHVHVGVHMCRLQVGTGSFSIAFSMNELPEFIIDWAGWLVSSRDCSVSRHPWLTF